MMVITRHAVVTLPLPVDTPMPAAIFDAAAQLVSVASAGHLIRVTLGPRDAQAWGGYCAALDLPEATHLAREGAPPIWIGYGPTSQVEVWT